MNPTGKGGFTKGVSGNPEGRKSRPVEERYLEIFRKAVTPEDWESIVARAVLDAKRGDTAARKFIADYLIGPPIERKEITGEDGKPLIVKVIKGVSLDEL
jgi:hypothetical protein